MGGSGWRRGRDCGLRGEESFGGLACELVFVMVYLICQYFLVQI